MTRAVVFDMYGTIAAIKKPTNPFKRLFEELGLEDQRLAHARRVAFTARFKNLSQFIERIAPGASVDTLSYERKIRAECASVGVYPDTIPVLTRLKSAGIQLGLISNLAFQYGRPLYSLGLAVLFDHIIFSFEAGMMKPEPRIYLDMINRLGLPPGEILMVGDGFNNDVLGPLSVGMRAVHLVRGEEPGPPSRISSLSQIFGLV